MQQLESDQESQMPICLWCSNCYVWIDIRGVYMCLACVPAENISTASPPVGPGDMEQRPPHLSRAAGYIFL